MNSLPIEKRFPLFTLCSDAVVVTDVNGQILYVNPTFEELTRYDRDEVIGQTPRIIKSGKQSQGFYEKLWQTLLSGKTFHSVFTNRKKDGELYQLEETISPFRDDNGEILYFVSMGRDLTQSRRADAELQKLALVSEQSADHVMITRPDGIIEYVNPAFEELTGYSTEEAVGRTPNLIKSGQHPQSFYAALWDTLLAGRVFRGMSINKKKNGDFYYEEKTITPLKDSEGTILYFVSVGRDVTARIQVEEELRASRQRLLTMNQILGIYTQPAVLKMLDSGVNPLNIGPHVIDATVFFTDIVQFSTLSESLAVEEVVELVEQYLTICTHVISSYGGEIFKFVGDSVLATFPFDQVDQAIRAGLEIVAALEALRESAPAQSLATVLYAGVGISLGRVTLGNIGSDIKKDYTILGDTVNVAERLQALTRQLSVPLCLSGAVKNSAQAAWDFIDLGEQQVKGKNISVQVYSVDDPRIRQSFLSGNQITRRIRNLLDQNSLDPSSAPEIKTKPKILWDASMATGVAELDAQHQELLAQFNELSVALDEGQGREIVGDILKFLQFYAKWHFGREDACMDEFNCPVAGVNRKAHQEFLEKFERLYESYQASGSSAELAIETFQGLHIWIATHIQKVDTGLYACVHRNA